MINYTYLNNQTKFIETGLILQTINLNLAIVGRNEGNFREREIFSGY